MKPPRTKPPRTILIVDDFAADRALFRRLLSRDAQFEYSFLEAEDGAQALEICRSQTPDCILLDYQLPDMNGAEILQKIVEQNGVSRIPVVMLSGSGNVQVAVDALKKGAQDYLVKDRQRESDDLQRAIGNAIEKVALERARLTAEERLRLYEKVILNTKDAVIITEAEPIEEPGPRIVYVNPAFTEQTGYTAEEAIGQTSRFLQGPKTDRAQLDAIYTNLKNWQPTRVEMTNYRKDGSEFEVEFEINAVADDSGWFTHWVSVQRDVTERKAREAQLRQSEANLRMALDASSAGSWAWDVAANVSSWDDNYHALYGFAPEMPRSFQLWMDSVDADDRARLQERIETLLTSVGDDVWDMEFRAHHPEKGERWMLNLGHVERDESGKATRFAGINLDITSRKQAEEALRRNHETFYNLVENAPFGIYIIDADFRLVQVSAGSQKAFGNVPTPLLGRDFAEIMQIVWGEPVASEVIALFRHTLESGEPYRAASMIEQRNDIDEVEAYDWKIERVVLPDGRFGVVCYFYDLTERNLTEAKLRESEARYRTLFDSIDEGFCVIEVIFDANEKPVDYSFIETNPAFMRQTGFQEMNGRRISELLPNHEQSWFDIYGNIVLTGEAARFENHAEEMGRWFDVFAFRFGEPEKCQVAVVFNDISERKRREMNLAFIAELQKDYAPLSSDLEIMEMTGARIIEYSKSSHCLFVEINQDTEEATVLYDRHAEDETNLAGVYRIADFHSEEERTRLMTGEPLVINDVRDGKRSMEAIESFEAMGIGSLVNAPYVSDGRWKFALTILRAQPCEWRDDEVELFSELASRIYLRMERARAESSLRESEERFRNLFDSIDEGFCTIEVIFDEHEKAVDFRFIELNPAFAKQTGMTNAIGETARELFPGLNEIWYERYGQVAVSGEALRFEDEVASLDRVFDIFASRIGSESNPRVAIVFTDITQRKRAEAEREEMLGREQVLRRGAEDANRAKDEFLAMLSHELRSPLNVILGWTQILEDRDFDRDTTQQAMAIIARNVRLQNALIEDLLDVSRIISGKMQLETENVSLVSLVRECLDAALPSAEKKEIALESNLDENAGEMLGDKHRLQQIFGNLLTNAIKFTPENGRIEVTLKRIGDRAQLSIEDSGIGIAPALLPQIFERFKQADASSKRQFGGLGLGLTIVKHLAQLHGGDVSAHSDGEGRGATFTVELPLAVKAVAENENAEESRARENLKPLAGLRVLVVDDDRDALELMQFVLQHKGATVSCASSASVALKKLDGESFDLLISDLGMPHMDGFDLIRQVRANGHADLPAIALTGYVSAEDRERVVGAGFQAHLPKPVNVENLFAAALNFARK